MHPLLTLVAGVAVGVVGVRMAKSANAQKALQGTAAKGGETVRTGLTQARGAVRGAAVSGLRTVENTSAALRRKLDDTPAGEMHEQAAPESSALSGGGDDRQDAS